jgi:hypothetical protein
MSERATTTLQDTSNTLQKEIRKIEPIAQPIQISPGPHRLRNTRHAIAIKHKQHKTTPVDIHVRSAAL